MISGSRDSTVKIWSVSDRRLLRSLSYHMVGVNGLRLNSRGDRLASGDGSGWLRVYDLLKQDEVTPARRTSVGSIRSSSCPTAT